MVRATFLFFVLQFFCYHSAFLGIDLPTSGCAYSQGWLEVTPPQLSHIDKCQQFDSARNGYEVYTWSDVGFRFSAHSSPAQFVSYWAPVCDTEPPGYGHYPYFLGSIAKVAVVEGSQKSSFFWLMAVFFPSWALCLLTELPVSSYHCGNAFPSFFPFRNLISWVTFSHEKRQIEKQQRAKPATTVVFP